MKTFVTRASIIMLVFCYAVSCSAPPAQERYLQANALYGQGELRQAYTLYDSIEKKGPAVLINLGNTAYELERYGQALIAWRRAQRQSGIKEFYMLQERIATLHDQISGTYQSTFFERLSATIDVYMRVLPYKIWQLLFLIVMACAFFLLRFILNRRWILLISWCTLILVISMLLMVRYTVRNRVMGILLHDTNVYVTKDQNARVKKALSLGQEVRVYKKHDAWYQITDGTVVGWVPHQSLEIVP